MNRKVKEAGKEVAVGVSIAWLKRFGQWLAGRPDVWAARRAKRRAKKAG